MDRKVIAVALELAWPLPWHLDIYAGVQRYAADDDSIELRIDEFPHLSESPLPDGVIARVTPELAEWASLNQVPLINVYFHSPVAEKTVTFVADEWRRHEMVAEYLLAKGLQHFACFSWRSKLDGFHTALKEAGCTCKGIRLDDRFLDRSETWRVFEQVVPKALSTFPKPLGLYIGPTFLGATGPLVSTLCGRLGLRIPGDVAIVEGSNHPMFVHQEPSLTSVDPGYDNIGFEAARAMAAWVKEGRVPESRQLAPRGIVERESTDYFFTKDAEVMRALDFLKANLRDPITVDEVAEAVFVSRRTLERRFRAELGQSVAVELRRLRIAKAKQLIMRNSKMSLKEIAFEVGFQSGRHFYDAFRAVEKSSPTEYREKSPRFSSF